jgi:hypothetical protein
VLLDQTGVPQLFEDGRDGLAGEAGPARDLGTTAGGWCVSILPEDQGQPH